MYASCADMVAKAEEEFNWYLENYLYTENMPTFICKIAPLLTYLQITKNLQLVLNQLSRRKRQTLKDKLNLACRSIL